GSSENSRASASASRRRQCAKCCSQRVSSRRRGECTPPGEASWQAQSASVLARDFLTVETAFLQRIYVLFSISLATRRIEYVACSANPDGRWVAQQARNLVMHLGDEQSFRFLPPRSGREVQRRLRRGLPLGRHQG